MGGIKHFYRRLVDCANLKMLLVIIGEILIFLYGDFDTSARIFLGFFIVDFITGYAKAIKYGVLQSWCSRKAWSKVVTYSLAIIMANFLQQAGVPGIRDYVLLWCVVTEAISVVENLDALGVNIPQPIKRKLSLTRDLIENSEHDCGGDNCDE